MVSFNPNKAQLFESRAGVRGGQFEPFIFQEELIQYHYN